MSNRRYNGEPIDASWTSDLVDADNGTTVGASDDGEEGRVETEDWPTAIPKSVFKHDKSQIQTQVIKHLVRFPNASDYEVAQAVGCSTGHVNSVRGKVSMFVEPSEVPFEIQEIPTKSGLTENLLGHEESRFDVDSWAELRDKAENRDTSEEADIDVEDIGQRFYENGESTQSIASDYGVSRNVIQGKLQGYDKDNHDGNGQTDSVRGFGVPSGVFSETQKEVFDHLIDNPESNYSDISSELDVSPSTIARTKHRSQCYVAPESLPFGVPEGPKEWAVTNEDWVKYQRNPPEASSEPDSKQRQLPEKKHSNTGEEVRENTANSTKDPQSSSSNEYRQRGPSTKQAVSLLAVGACLGALLQRLFRGDAS